MEPPTHSSKSVARSEFAQDIFQGLTATPKQLSSKYFYDARGDKLFQQIMQMPEYYLTDCELEIFQTHHRQILSAIGPGRFDLVELGAGDGMKTKILLRHFLEEGADFRYRPVDISGSVLRLLEADLQQNMPALEVDSLSGDYLKMLEEINTHEQVRKVILFLGANIGNLEIERARQFIRRIAENMHAGDLLLLGVDLKKDPQVILNAYDDPAGITAAFNLNLLQRINRELDGDFDLDSFLHWESYNPQSGSAKSYLVSRKSQAVRIGALNTTIDFEAWEAIHMELSQKYSLSEVEGLAQQAGLQIVRHFFDAKKYFVDSLWRK